MNSRRPVNSAVGALLILMFRPLFKILSYMFIGGVVCWAPDATIHLVRGYNFSSIDVRFVTIFMPLFVFTAYLMTLRIVRTPERTPSVAFYMVAGIWYLGSVATMINATPTGGGFSSPGRAYVIAFCLLPLPPYTNMAATYDGSLAGLAFASLALLSMHFVFERRHWILPRRFMEWLGLPAV